MTGHSLMNPGCSTTVISSGASCYNIDSPLLNCHPPLLSASPQAVPISSLALSQSDLIMHPTLYNKQITEICFVLFFFFFTRFSLMFMIPLH